MIFASNFNILGNCATYFNKKLDKSIYVKESKKFIEQLKVSAMVDLDGSILTEKESPADDIGKFKLLFERRKKL